MLQTILKSLFSITVFVLYESLSILTAIQAGAELCQAQDKIEVIVYIGVKVEFELRCSYELRCSQERRCSYELRCS